MNNKIYKLKKGEIWLDDNKIIRISSHEKWHISLEDTKEQIEIVKKIANGENYHLSIDITNVTSIEREARLYYSKQDFAGSVAFVAKNNLSRVIGNFFIGLNHLSVPCRVFSSTEESIKWLKGFDKAK